MGLRQQRLADEVRDVVSSCFLGGRLNDPRLENVSITAAKVTPDLQLAYVYFRLYDQSKLEEAMEGLESVKGFLKKQISIKIKARRVPELKFFYDESVETGARVEELLAELKNKGDI